MRSRTLLVIALSGAATASGLAGCATPQAKATCYPVASWTTPVLHCPAAPPPVVVAPPPPPPAPEPVKPEAEPEPPQTAKLQTEKIELSETVQFENDSAVLIGRSKTLLDEVARELTEHPEVKRVLIEGYTDSNAGTKHNQKLSEQRVASVKAYLVEKGIDGGRLKTKGFGETHPVADNKTEEGRAKNRRVEFRILDRKRK